jgi:hypothetical protein
MPADHLAWFVMEAIEEIDLDSFCGTYRRDGHVRAAHEPSMMVALLVYARMRSGCARHGRSSGAAGRI